MIIDTHCHFDLYSNPKEVINKSEKLGIITIGMTNLPSHFKLGYPFVRNLKKTRLALGLHPLMAKHHFEELPYFIEYLNYTSYLGEIGLDFSKEGIDTKDIQLNSFEKILQAISGDKKMLSIHSRGAEKEVISLLKKYKIKNAIFHWYTGGLKQVDEIVNLGYYFSINTAMIKSLHGQKIIRRIPKESILTESDGPFIKQNNRVVESSDIINVIDYLNAVFKSTKMEDQIVNNFMSIIKRLN